MEFFTDYITGLRKANIGAEANRQVVEKRLINLKGFSKEDIEVDAPIEIVVQSAPYRSKVDLIVSVKGKRVIAIKCAAGSLGSWERQIIAVARLNAGYQIPYAVASDGDNAVVWDALSGKQLASGASALPSKSEAAARLKRLVLEPLPEQRRHREALIFRSYDSMQVNVAR